MEVTVRMRAVVEACGEGCCQDREHGLGCLGHGSLGDSGPGLVTFLGEVLQVCQWLTHYLSEGKAWPGLSLPNGRLPVTTKNESGRGRRQEDAVVGDGDSR